MSLGKATGFHPTPMRHRQPRERIASRTSATATPAASATATPAASATATPADHHGTAWLDASSKHRARQRELKELFHCDHYVPAEPVAEYLAVGIPGLRLLIAKGLPCHRLSPRVTRFRKSEVVQWINALPC